MNSEGVILFIGVDDDGNVNGLENDYHLLKKKNPEGFEQEIMQSIDKYLKNKNAKEHIKINYQKKLKKNFVKLI
jgi:hypothetical protein